MTERGTYRLNVSPLQRTFQVQSGLLRFNGEPGFNPGLDIRAVYTSRSINSTYGGRNDVRVGVRITGTLANPGLDLYAADSLLGLSQSDLLSYVLFDQPSFSVSSGTSSAMACCSARSPASPARARLVMRADSWTSCSSRLRPPKASTARRHLLDGRRAAGDRQAGLGPDVHVADFGVVPVPAIVDAAPLRCSRRSV